VRIRRPLQRPRVAFVFEPARAAHVPSRCDWADAARVEVTSGDWRAAFRSLAAADVTLAFDPGDAAAALREAPGLRVAIVLDPRCGSGAVGACRAGDAEAFTWPERWAGSEPRPFQVLPPPLDDARFGARPRLGGDGVLVPEWAAPPEAVRLRLGRAARLLPAASRIEDVAAAAERAAALVWCSGAATLDPDPRLLAALARGLLVVADAPPPPDWALEPGDDLLVCSAQEMPDAIGRAAAEPGALAQIRVRAWQRVLESFSAAALERLVWDARTLLPPRAAQEAAR